MTDVAPPARAPMGATMTTSEKLVIMAALMTAMFLFALDQSIAAAAVPRVVADLGGLHLLGWVFSMMRWRRW